MKKIAIFDQYVALSRVVNGATVRCCKQNAAGPWQVGDIAGSSKAAVFVDRGRQTTKRQASVNLAYVRKPRHYAQDSRHA